LKNTRSVVVVYPTSSEQISSILSFANVHLIPVFPFEVDLLLKEALAFGLKVKSREIFKGMCQIIDSQPTWRFLVNVLPPENALQAAAFLKEIRMFSSLPNSWI
jgi:hypothetical protein